MKQFLKMIETVKATGIFYDDKKGKTLRVEPSHFYRMVEAAQVFVFSPINKEPVDLDICNPDGVTHYEKLDAPFSVFSIEVLGGLISGPTPLDEAENRSVCIHCILAYELEPKKFAYYFYGDVNGVPMVYSTRTLDAIVSQFVERLNSRASVAGSEKANAKVKLGSGEKQSFHRIRRIIHIRAKNDKITTNPESTRKIDWTHRWNVRGHWRVHAGLGKDRSGIYCVEGFTWVSEHEKGPEHQPLVTKARVVGGEP